MILWAAREAAGLITVCQALKDRLVELGVEERRIRVLRNGVDLALFRPGPREALRTKYGFTGQTVLSVGHLIPRKGHDIVIDAMAELPEARLVIVGEGPERQALDRASPPARSWRARAVRGPDRAGNARRILRRR